MKTFENKMKLERFQQGARNREIALNRQLLHFDATSFLHSILFYNLISKRSK